MGKLQARFDGLNRRTLIRIGLPLQALLRLDSIRRQTGQSREEVVHAALEEWAARHEKFLSRRRRLRLQKQLREAGEGVPVESLVQDFLANSENDVEHSSIGRTSVRRGVYVSQMLDTSGMTSLKARRLQIGFTQDELAEAAGCSRGAIRLYESGSVPQKSKVLKLIERALTDAEGDIA